MDAEKLMQILDNYINAKIALRLVPLGLPWNVQWDKVTETTEELKAALKYITFNPEGEI